VLVRDQSRDGFLLEAPTANLWWVREGKLFTPSLDLGILAGITRSKVAQLAAGAGIPVEEGRFTAEHLLTADEAFLSSSIREVTSIVTVDGRALGTDAPGPLTRRISEDYQRLRGA
jgi:branched-subunit amino acid aminotransferase/4-amino-4-deoxychorismate lyase